MSVNVKLWFAKDKSSNIVTINEIDDGNRKEEFLCPMCGSNLIPKATKSTQVTSHFAHTDKSKCNSESMIHWWFKHKFIEAGDEFTITSGEKRSYICKDIEVEVSHKLSDGSLYKPDITIQTECGETVYFEMAFSNKKKVKDYLDHWLELKNIVVEVDIKHLLNTSEVPEFKALFYNGKCFNVKKNDTYYNTIGQYKEVKLYDKVDDNIKARLKKLDWLWRDVLKYKKGEIGIETLSESLESIDSDDKEIIDILFKKPNCINVMNDIMQYKLDQKYREVCEYIKLNFGEKCLKYLGKDLEYVRMPFVGSWYESIIFLQDLYNNYCNRFNFSRQDNTERIFDIIDAVLPLNVNVEEYNLHATHLQEKLKRNCLYRSISSYLVNKKGYEFSYKINPYDHKAKNLNDFTIAINLKYKNKKIKGCNFNRKFQLHSNVDEFFEEAFIKIKNYFQELQPFKYVEELDEFSNRLQITYEEYGINIVGEEYYEDIYLIKSINDYYIFNDCVSLDKEKKEVIADIDNVQDVFTCITNNINDDIIEETRRRCYECGEKFALELGEVKFFIRKGFDYPKRCKPCRKARKTN